MGTSYSFKEELWIYPGDAAWHFITLPKDYAEEIKAISPPLRRGFGSLRVLVAIGKDSWNTSIFPDAKRKSYLLPIKKEIRKNNNLQAGDKVQVKLTLLDS